MIVGHDQIIKILHEFADSRSLTHGYIFFGPDMTGKRTIALALANYFENHDFGCEEGRVLNDCHLVSPGEKNSIGIDEVRSIKYFLFQKPNVSPYRTVIVDDGHLLTEEAQNALLKITEDPPASALIILILKDPESVKATLSSRFQQIYFPSISEKIIVTWLKGKHGVALGQAEDLAKHSLGAPGRALRLLHDKKFQELQESARRFIKITPIGSKDFIKNLIEPDDFNLEKFLDAVILNAHLNPKKDVNFLRKALELRRQAAFFNLNPRLQLEALANQI